MKSKISLLVFFSVVLLAAFSCEPEPDGFVTFLIPKDAHYATARMSESLQSSSLIFDARFDETAIYDFHDEASQTNKNKLLGFSDCNSMHHENSARFAWQWHSNQLEIYAYCYVNSIRREEFIGTVPLNESSHYRLEVTASSYIFYLNDLPPVKIERENVCDKGLYYMLWPYFGGSLPAPHDVSIHIKRVY